MKNENKFHDPTKKMLLIDANEAYEAVTDLSGQADTKSAYAAFWKAGKVIQNLPTVDAVEVVHGRWEKAKYHGFLRCSECKDVYIYDAWVADGKWNYCPNCGAKMDGAEDNDHRKSDQAAD